MDDARETRAVPAWFWIAAILALLWEALGCTVYWLQVSTDPATMPIDQRAMWQATPTWMVAAYAVAVWVGLVGAVLLLLRRLHAVPVLLVSLLAVIVQFSGLLIVPGLRDRTPADAYIGPIVILVVCYGVWQFARYSQKRGWLR